MVNQVLLRLKSKISIKLLKVSIATVCLALLGFTSLAQTKLPSSEVLKDHRVKSITVYETPLRFQGGISENPEYPELESTRSLQEKLFLNEFGKLDSIIKRPTDTSFYQKELFEYDSEKRLVDYKVLDSNGTVISHHKIASTENNESILEKYEHGYLRERQHINSEGYIYEKLLFYPPNTEYTTRHTFDFINNIHETQIVNTSDIEYSIETFQWFAEDGNPSSFKHSLEEKLKGKKKPVFKEKEYPLDTEGNVINKYSGRFDDPYINCNYYERFEKLEPIYFPDQNRLTADHMIFEEELTSLYSFTGIELVYLYEMEYEYH